ncbi:MAG: Inactivated superfamily I helicase, partial [Betaproteobacteria bacterium]
MLNSTPLPAGESFLDALASEMLERCAGEVAAGDLSDVLILVPALPIAAELRTALLHALPRPLLLPRFDTLTHWVQNAQIKGFPELLPNSLPESERLVLLHEALRQRGWFDESALWGIASEMAGLFDELTVAAVKLPEDEAGLAEQLHQAYALRASAPLAFEARVVHELWHALAAVGQPDAAASYRLRLAALARQAEAPESPRHLLVLLDAMPQEALDPAEQDFLQAYAQKQTVQVFHPAPREAVATPLMATLDAAWPQTLQLPMYERAEALAQALPQSPLRDRLQLVPASGREPEAQAAVAQIGRWLQSGLRRIVLITQDRLTARRVRALLEREGVLVNDETGWKLSTSRAAAAVDALIETAASNAYYRDFLDLCKSPYVFADCDQSQRKAAVFTLEAAIREASVKAGLPKIRRCLLEADQAESKDLGLSLIDRV